VSTGTKAEKRTHSGNLESSNDNLLAVSHNRLKLDNQRIGIIRRGRHYTTCQPNPSANTNRLTTLMQEQVPRAERQLWTVPTASDSFCRHGRRDKGVCWWWGMNVFVCVSGIGHGLGDWSEQDKRTVFTPFESPNASSTRHLVIHFSARVHALLLST
jgi:hypothetical protein